ncbi:MAG: DUF4038 domain-containing protein [Isosphaeraceae bacterium]
MRSALTPLLSALVLAMPSLVARGADVAAWSVFEASFDTTRHYANPFVDVEVNVVFTCEDRRWVMPAFWAGGRTWKVRFAPPGAGEYRYRVEASDRANADLNAKEGTLAVSPSAGENPLLRRGFLGVGADRRHFEHADGTPFLWLGDTWWKCLCKRLTFEDFRELAADRKAKGFSVVQIVCGPYPDEGLFEDRWENEGGKPYENRDFSVVNPRYFEFADRRIGHLVEAGLVPAIVGGWGRGDCDGMAMAGLDGMKRHRRHLVARYGALPTVWIVGGESGGPRWTELARHVRSIDPYDRPLTIHPFASGRLAVTDETVLNFDMLQTGHGDMEAARAAIPKLIAASRRDPPMPALIGEFCYEGHMQAAYDDAQRYVFWGSMLSGAAGLTYGAAGIWHASVDGDPGLNRVYDPTTWREGKDLPGSRQLGFGKKLLERYRWASFGPHPEWAESGAFAAGIPGEVRFVYQPKRGVYNWSGLVVKRIERDVPYRAHYFDPIRGRRHEAGSFVFRGTPQRPFEGHSRPLLACDQFSGSDGSAWTDHGTPTGRRNGRLVGGKGMATVLDPVVEAAVMASADAGSNAEAGIMLRFHDAGTYLVALYSPSLKAIFLHDRRQGSYGEPLGKVDVPEIGPRFRISAAASGAYAAMVLTDGARTYFTPLVKVTNLTPGRTGLWLYQIGDRQEFADFRVSRARFAPELIPRGEIQIIASDEYRAPPVPSPQDWVLVLERIKGAQ